MIVRSWRGRARAETADRYVEHLETAVLPELRLIAGFRDLWIMRRDLDAEVEFVIQTCWQSMAAIRRFAGPEPEIAVVPPEARALLSSFDPQAVHYRVVRPGVRSVGRSSRRPRSS